MYAKELERAGFTVQRIEGSGGHLRIHVEREGVEFSLTASASPKNPDHAAREIMRDARRRFDGTHRTHERGSTPMQSRVQASEQRALTAERAKEGETRK
jgi:hypothetical protein